MNAVSHLRDPANGLAMPTTARSLGWWGVLPPIECQGIRWWLPLSDRATIVVGHAITSSASAAPSTADPVAIQQILTGFLSDPPLQIFAASRWPGHGLVAASELAEWFLGEVTEWFSGGEWMLSAPKIEAHHQRHWSRLMATATRQAPTTWLDQASDWFAVLGAPTEFTHRFPTLVWDDERLQPSTELFGSSLLQRMARARNREHVMTTSLGELANKRKLAAAKQLAYGLSHEINNPLANISARAQQLKHGEPDPQRAATLDRIVEQVYRAHEMIAGLMFFANPPEPVLSRVNLNTLVREAVADFQDSATETDIHLLVEANHQEAVASVDGAMMLEAIRALIRNSMEAVDYGGTVVVSVEPDESSPDSRWLVHVADSGPGLDAETARHAFDPFYSGREAGRGLGLGLCRAYRVAKLHGATIHLTGGLAGCVATIAVLKPTERNADLPANARIGGELRCSSVCLDVFGGVVNS